MYRMYVQNVLLLIGMYHVLNWGESHYFIFCFYFCFHCMVFVCFLGKKSIRNIIIVSFILYFILVGAASCTGLCSGHVSHLFK